MDIYPSRRTDNSNKILEAARMGVGNSLKTISQQGGSQRVTEYRRNLTNRGELGAKNRKVG